jgi:hypothetical protein
LAIRNVLRPSHIEDIVHALQIRGDAIEPVSEFHRNRIEINSAALLKVSELRDLEPIEKNLPPDSPRAERRRFPIVLFESNVVFLEIDSDCAQAFEIQILMSVGVGLSIT